VPAVPDPALVSAALGVRLAPLPVAVGASGATAQGTPLPPLEGEPLISVVIPTAGRPDEIARCLESLLGQTWPSFEIVVVDNNPTHDAVRAAVSPVMAKDDRIRLIHHPEGGSSGARNQGMREAAGELIAATDDDVVVHPNWLAALVRAFDDPGVDCVTGLVVPMGLDTRAQELFEEFGGFGKGFAPKRYDLAANRGPGRLYPYTVGTYGSGNNVAFRARLVKEVGEYDPLLGPGSVVRAGQDIDLFLRVLFAGGTIAYEPKAIVRHEHRATMEALQKQIYNYGRGLSAVMLKQMLDDPRRLVDIATRLPGAAYYLLAPNSGKNVARGSEYPAEISRAELRGLMDGALVYLRSRYRPRGAMR
jgi:GT2 family glycosyltransferase